MRAQAGGVEVARADRGRVAVVSGDGTVAVEVELVVKARGWEVAAREVCWSSRRVGEGVRGVVGWEGAVRVAVGGLRGRFLKGGACVGGRFVLLGRVRGRGVEEGLDDGLVDCGGGGVEVGRVGEDGCDLGSEGLVPEFVALGTEGDANGEVLLIDDVPGVEAEAVGLGRAADDFACDVELGTLARHADEELARAITACVK